MVLVRMWVTKQHTRNSTDERMSASSCCRLMAGAELLGAAAASHNKNENKHMRTHLITLAKILMDEKTQTQAKTRMHTLYTHVPMHTDTSSGINVQTPSPSTSFFILFLQMHCAPYR